MMSSKATITRVEFRNFKAFPQFSLTINQMNILVGPNNSGKSTLLGAFRVLAAGIRRANAKSAEVVPGPEGSTHGHFVPVEDLPISLENSHTDYDDSKTTTIVFYLSNGNTLTLYFPPEGGVFLIPMSEGRPVKMPNLFRKAFPIRIEAIPVLGPVEHNEELLERRTVQRNLVTHRASRHFRNYWYHFPELFSEFSEMIRGTWSGMDITPPEFIDNDYSSLKMFCLEGRIQRELYWVGFGFQVWCQLLTHIVRSREATLLVVDEPEIYLHPDLQRRLLAILRESGPDIVMATHSTEMVSESDPADILIVDKTKRAAQRLKNTDQIQQAIDILGSSQNITLAQLARTQRILFVEGIDFKVIGRFAHQLGLTEIASKSDFSVVPVGGFSQWENVKAFAWGIEKTLGMPLMLAAIFDRDYRCEEHISDIETELLAHLRLAHIHQRKELENYLLVPTVLDKAIRSRNLENARRRGVSPIEITPAREILDTITTPMKPVILGQYISYRTSYFRDKGVRLDASNIATQAIEVFEAKWLNIETRMEIVPGKEVFSELNKYLNIHNISLTPIAVISNFTREEMPGDMMRLLRQLDKFRKSKLG